MFYGKPPDVRLFMLLHQLLHLVQKLIEKLKGGADGFGAGHIHAGDFQQADGVSAAAGGEEALVVLHGVCLAVQDPLCDGRRGGEAGAAGLFGVALIYPIEALKYLVLMFGGNTDAGILQLQ